MDCKEEFYDEVAFFKTKYIGTNFLRLFCSENWMCIFFKGIKSDILLDIPRNFFNLPTYG